MSLCNMYICVALYMLVYVGYYMSLYMLGYVSLCIVLVYVMLYIGMCGDICCYYVDMISVVSYIIICPYTYWYMAVINYTLLSCVSLG